MNMNDFKKYATKHLGMNSLVLDDVIKSQAGYLNPYILEERQLNVTQLDVFSRLMMDRIIFLGTEINDYTANTLQAQLLYLDSVDNSKDISIYINSPGGSVYAGLGIYDTMQFINSDVATICTGMAASMAAVLLVAGKETRDPAPTVTNGQLNYLKSIVVDYFDMDTICYYNGTSHTQKEDILSQLSLIPGFVTYSGHCTAAGWSSPYITATDVDTFSTEGAYSFVVNNCCKSSNFTSGVCFGEALLRKPSAGAIGVIGASNETLWNEDYYWSVGAKYPFSLYPHYSSEALGAFDRMFHVRNEDIQDYAITQGQMLQAGNMSVAQAGSPYENYYWEIYNLLGDPSLMPFVGSPDTMLFDIQDTIRQGDISMECIGIPWTHVAIYEDTALLAATFLDQTGYGKLTFTKPITYTNVLLTATAQNHIPIVDTIEVLPPKGAKVILSDYYFVDTMGNVLNTLFPNQKVY